MKSYTDKSQTAKLIELGFEKPKTIVDKYYDYDAEAYKEVNHYSIGELIEILPIRCLTKGLDYRRVFIEDGVFYYDQNTGSCIIGFVDHRDLIDNIFDAILRLKEKGVI